MLFYKIFLILFFGAQLMGANHIYFHNTEIYNTNNCYMNLLCELLVEVVKKKNLENNIEIMNFIDSIDQDKYGRGTISTRIDKTFAEKSPNLLLLHKLLNEVAELSDRYRSGNSDGIYELSKVVHTIAQGNPICRMPNYRLEAYLPILKSNKHVEKIKDKTQYQNFLDAIKSDGDSYHFIDINDFFEVRSEDLLVIHNIIDLCIQDVQKKPYSQYEKNSYISRLHECQEAISKYYYGENY